MRHILSTQCVILLGMYLRWGVAVTKSTLDEMKTDIAKTFGLSPSYGDPCNAKINPCPKGDNMGAILRLVFHDAAGQGGPNGCIDLAGTSDHKGLEDIVKQLDEIYLSKNYSSEISRADFWVVAGNLVIEYASTQVRPVGGPVQMDPSPGTLYLPFRYGRVDAPTCSDVGWLPDAGYNWSDMKKLFVGRFGFNVQETVAIMGAHSLGRCEYANSGYDGGWMPFQSSFSNFYFKNFGGVRWTNLNNSFVWTDDFPNGPQTILLKADVELLFETNSSSSGYCDIFASFNETARCPLQKETNAAFMAYADSNMGIKYFYGNFSTAWEKLTEYTYNSFDLRDVDL